MQTSEGFEHLDKRLQYGLTKLWVSLQGDVEEVKVERTEDAFVFNASDVQRTFEF